MSNIVESSMADNANESTQAIVPSSDGTNAGTSSKSSLPKAKSKRKSWVWDHFTEGKYTTPSDRRAICKYCNKSLACPSTSGTSCLSNHLQRCKKYPANQEKQRPLSFQPKIEGSLGSATTHSLAPWKFDQKECRKYLARMIIIDELSFRHVEHEGFRDFCHKMQPLFTIPSRQTIARDCYDLYKEERMNLKNYFKKLSSRVCLTTDSWTSIQNLSYMCLTAHWIDDDWKLHKKIINFCPISGHSGEIIGKSVERCLLDWGIDRILTVTVDNASSNDLGIHYLKKRLNSWKRSVLNGEYLHMRCAAHILNLIVKDGLSEVNESVLRIRSAVKYVRSSPSRFQKFKSCVEQEKIDSKAFVCLDVETRWNSTYLMLQSALKFQKAFDLLLIEDGKYVTELLSKKGLPSDMDWEYIKYFVAFLEVFYETTLSLSGSLYVTGNEYLKQIYGLGLIISSWCESDDSCLKAMATKMKEKFNKYWANVNNVNIMLFVAVVLDPRCKLEYVHFIIDASYDTENSAKLKDKLNTVLSSMFDFYSPSHAPVVESSNEKIQDLRKTASGKQSNVSSFVQNMFKKQKVSQGGVESKTELDKYLSEDLEDESDNFDILNWWKVNASRYRVLSLIARDVLAIPVSTVASESAFSTGGRILDSF